MDIQKLGEKILNEMESEGAVGLCIMARPGQNIYLGYLGRADQVGQQCGYGTLAIKKDIFAQGNGGDFMTGFLHGLEQFESDKPAEKSGRKKHVIQSTDV